MKSLHIKYALAVCLSAMLLLPNLATGRQRSSYHGYFDSYKSKQLKRISAVFGVGTTAFRSDLNELTDQAYQNNYINGQASIGISFRLTNYLSVRTEGGFYKLYSRPNGESFPQAIGRPSISSSNWEAYAVLVHDLIPKFKNEGAAPPWNVYAFVGAGATLFNPKNAETKEDLRPQKNNPRSTFYPNLAKIFPVGLGFEYYTADNGSIGIEASYRFTETDYLDDMLWQPIEGRPHRDGYLVVSIKYKYTFLNSPKYRR